MAKILIVDDEKNLRLLYEKELQEEGYDVLLAESANSALNIVEKESPDVVVLDIRMPGRDGIEAMGMILGKNHKMPIILNTAYNCYRDNFMSWSADAYLVKSSDLTELKREIRKLTAP